MATGERAFGVFDNNTNQLYDGDVAQTTSDLYTEEFKTVLYEGETLTVDETMWSQNGGFFLMITDDNNLEFYSNNGTMIWESGTSGQGMMPANLDIACDDYPTLKDDAGDVL